MSGEADGTALIAEEQAIPTWRPRSYLTEETPVGKPYRWNGQVYRLWQQHDATGQPGWSPDLAFSLWDICHTTDPARAKDYLSGALRAMLDLGAGSGPLNHAYPLTER